MPLLLDPTCRCRLELNGESVELSMAELSSLRECMAESTRPLQATLSKGLLRDLFAKGMLTPSELAGAAESAYWNTALPSLALSPYLGLKLDFASGNTGMSGIEPPIAMFLQPDFLEAAVRLSNEINQGLARAANACAVRNTLFPRDKGLAMAHQLAWNWLQARPELARWFEWSQEQDGSLRLSVPDYSALCSPAPTFPLGIISLSLNDRAGPPEPRRLVMPLESLSAITRVMDALRADATESISGTDLGHAAVRRVLGAIESVGGFIGHNEAPPIFAPRATADLALAITHMGHASLIVDGGGCRVLIDPWLFSWHDDFEKQPVTSRQLGPVDAIVFTHHHNDHLNINSLLTLPHDVPVFVPRELGTPLAPKTRAFLELVGFKDVRWLAHGESYTAGDGLTVTAIPFFGEGQNRLGFGANCYMISRLGRNVLIHADASPDCDGRSLASTGYLQEIVARWGSIQVVFGTWWQERQFVARLAPLAIFSPKINPQLWLDDTEVCDCPPDFLRDLVHISGASQMILYAESGRECFLPREKVSAFVPTMSFLWTPLAEIQQTVRQTTGATVMEAKPYLTVGVPEQGSPYVEQSGVATSWRRP